MSASALGGPYTLHVSPAAAIDRGDGSAARPMRSLTSARDAARKLHTDGDPAATVVIHLAPGTYGATEGVPLELDGAQGDGNLVFRGTGDVGARPLLSGGV